MLTPFLGAKWGVQLADDATYKDDAPYSALTGVYGGLQLTPEWRIDVGYQYTDDLFAETNNVNIETALIDTGLRYDWYIERGVSLYGRVGFGFWDTTKEGHSVALSEQGVAPLYEVGATKQFHKNWQFNVGYQGIIGIGNQEIGEYDSHALVAGVSYYFGSKETTQKLASDVESVNDKTFSASERVVETATAPCAEEIPQLPSLLLTDSILVSTSEFEFESYVLPDDQAISASELMSILNANPHATVEVIGHTDSTGPEVYNKTLSLQRAEAVASALEGLGVQNEKIIVEGAGEVNPIATNETVSGRAMNRRVEVYAVPVSTH